MFVVYQHAFGVVYNKEIQMQGCIYINRKEFQKHYFVLHSSCVKVCSIKFDNIGFFMRQSFLFWEKVWESMDYKKQEMEVENGTPPS